MGTRYAGDPRVITARFGYCAKCGKAVKGQQVYYWPNGKKVYCMDCGEYDYNTFLAAAADEDLAMQQFGGGTGYENNY